MSGVTLTIPIYQRKWAGALHWTTLGLGGHTAFRSGKSTTKLQQTLVEDLRKTIATLTPGDLEKFQFFRGTALHRSRLQLNLRLSGRRRKAAGLFPLIVEPRSFGGDGVVSVAYHPLRQAEWFVVNEDRSLEESATAYLNRAWAHLDTDAIEALKTERKDLLKTISFSVDPPSLLDRLPQLGKGVFDDLSEEFPGAPKQAGVGGGPKVLGHLGVNLTIRSIDRSLALGMPRAPYRDQLMLLASGADKRPILVVGPPGVGKSTIIFRWVRDLLEADQYEIHGNLDRIHQVWSISGKRIIAGMSYFGEWEQRCIELLEDTARRGRIVLLVEDLPAWGRIGRSRQSERNLAEFFRGPLARGEVAMIAECTPEQLQRLEDDAPSFAALFTKVHVAPTSLSETMSMMVHEARRLELRHRVSFDPLVYRGVLEIGGSLLPGSVFPGKALDLIRDLGKLRESPEGGSNIVAPQHLLEALSQKTGLPRRLLEPDTRLDPSWVIAELERRVLGQDEAVQAACDLVCRVRAGLVDPKRPYSVTLLTGPTGTGKTELAKAIASMLYGDESRLLRFDMSELGTPDAAARLVGDRWRPEGQLTQRVREQPFCVILLDEIEKAHPAVLNLLLQLFDEGRLTDAAGNTADFTHAVLLMTSNLGARVREPVGFGEHTERIVQDVKTAVRDFFPPELFNRIDRVVSFRPLGRDIAAKIAEKEIYELFGRRGLTERNIYVYANEAVFERIVDEAFDAMLGARPLQRYLDSTIGALLADEITRGGVASMRIFRIFEREGTFQLHVEPLREVAAEEASYPIEALLDRSLEELRDEVVPAARRLSALKRAPAFRDVSEKIDALLMQENRGEGAHAERIYHLDFVRHRVDELETWVNKVRGAGLDRGELIELQKFSREVRASRGAGERTTKMLDRRAFSPMTRMFREEILDFVAEVGFLHRNVAHADDPRRHSVFIELLRVGQARRQKGSFHLPALRGRLMDAFRSEPDQLDGILRRSTLGLLETLCCVYADARGELEDLAGVDADGQLRQGDPARGLGALLVDRPEHVVMKVSGFEVYDFFAGEEGCQTWRSSTHGSELVRTRVSPAEPGVLAIDRLRAHVEQRARFQQALEQTPEGHTTGVPLEIPENPERLLPAVRRFVFDPPAEGASALATVEDYRLAYSCEARVKTLHEVFRDLWLLRMSREPSHGARR